MKPEMYSDSLLDDVLVGEAAAASSQRTILLEQMLHVARARRRRRRTGVTLLLLPLLAAPMILFRSSEPVQRSAAVRSKTAPAEAGGFPGCAVIRSQPLPSGMLIVSDASTVWAVDSSREGLVVVETVPSPGLVREVSDQELLTLLAGRPAALVRQPDRAAELLLVNPDDRNGFPIH